MTVCPRKSRLINAILCLWALLTLAGFTALVRYQSTPGLLAARGATPASDNWPSQATFRHGAKPSLVMFLHPKCVCSQASLTELSRVIASCPSQFDAFVVFVQPHNAPADWLSGSLYRRAASMPGVRVSVDLDAKMAAAFGAFTSGTVLVYDALGTLKFRGGITDGRGHEGDNAGLADVIQLIKTGYCPHTSAPVFGCALGVQSSQGKTQ